MMPLPLAVVRTTARVSRLIKPTLLVFLEARHCRRMSVGKYGTGSSSSRPSDVEFRTRSLTQRNVDAAQPGDGRVSRVKKERRLEDGLNEFSSSAVANAQCQPRKRRVKMKSGFVGVPESPLQLSNSSSSDQDEGDVTLSSQTIGSHLAKTSRADPMPIDEPSPEADLYDEQVEDVTVFRQAANPPLPKVSFISRPSYNGISGKAAAIAYLRIRGLANRGKKKTFYAVLAWVLRHAARDLGFEIVPDGFVRIADLLQFELFQNHTLETFATACVDDMFDRFEVMSLPDLVNGEMREIWWARARESQTIPGVHASSKRIINMGKLQTVVYRAPFTEWPKIQKYGILEDPDRLIRLYQSEASYFCNIVPRHSKQICITIDAQKAAELGVTFFHTLDVDLLAVGKNGAIPVEAIRSVVELEVMKQDLI